MGEVRRGERWRRVQGCLGRTRLNVAGGGRLVQDEDAAFAQKRTRQAHQLALADAKVFAACVARHNGQSVRVWSPTGGVRRPRTLDDGAVQLRLERLDVGEEGRVLERAPQLIVRVLRERVEIVPDGACQDPARAHAMSAGARAGGRRALPRPSEPEKRTGSCGMMDRRERRSCRPSGAMWTSSSSIRPDAASRMRKSASASDDLPAPVRPTTPTLWCASALKETS